MLKLNRTSASIVSTYPERILQFGGGNFLRGFVDWMVDNYNSQSDNPFGVTVVKVTPRGDYQQWKEQDGLYYVGTKGIKNGQLVDEFHLNKSISKILHAYNEWPQFLRTATNPDLNIIISNTTESGLQYSSNDQLSDTPPSEFPAKLTIWLYHRYLHFAGSADAGCTFIPTELLVDNGQLLKECILQNAQNWNLSPDFINWVDQHNTFCNTLVDRIIPGVAKDKLSATWEKIGFEDYLITEGEPYHLWVIEAPDHVKGHFPIHQSDPNIVFTNDATPYRVRKVRILNGAHTAMVPVAYLFGLRTVRETVENPILGTFVKQIIFDEILPTLDMPKDEIVQYANDVLDRFKNPFIQHYLLTISLNSMAKFKARLLPTLEGYIKVHHSLPEKTVFAFACLIQFYRGRYQGVPIKLNDSEEIMNLFNEWWHQYDSGSITLDSLVSYVLQWENHWGKDLSSFAGLRDRLVFYLTAIENNQLESVLKELIKSN